MSSVYIPSGAADTTMRRAPKDWFSERCDRAAGTVLRVAMVERREGLRVCRDLCSVAAQRYKKAEETDAAPKSSNTASKF